MFYRENGQFKTSYRADQQIFPIRQDRVAIALLLIVAFVVVPATASSSAMAMRSCAIGKTCWSAR